MFVSNCPGIDATVAAELLNHLLECMPLNEDHFQDVLMDLITDTTTPTTTTTSGGHNDGTSWQITSGGRSISSSSIMALSPAPSSVSSSEDLDDTLDGEDSPQSSAEQGLLLDPREATNMPTPATTVPYPQSMWRPW